MVPRPMKDPGPGEARLTDAPPTLKSPCIRVCAVDGSSGLCIGCLRTMPEIVRWGAMSAAERDKIMDSLEQRRGRIAPEKLALLG